MRQLLVAALPVAISASVLLSACNAVGKGNKPESVAIQPDLEVAGVASTKAYACLPKRLNFIVTFTNGEQGNYVNQAKWTSSDPSVVAVSNGDIGFYDGTASKYSSGLLLAQGGTGTATITAEYLGFKKSIQVQSDVVTGLHLVPASIDIAPGSFGDFNLMGSLNGVDTSLDATWTLFDTATGGSADTVGVINSLSGAVSANPEAAATTTTPAPSPSTRQPLTARATLANCPTTVRPNTFDGTVNVSSLVSMSLSRDPSFSSDDLVVGTSEKLTATGTLFNGQTQDLSFQSAYRIVDSANATSTSIGQLLGSFYSYIQATKASGPQSITASFGVNPVTSNPALNITPIDATLTALNITTAPTPPTIKAGGSVTYKSTGTYTPTLAPGTSITQPNTAHVQWVSNAPTSIAVGTSTSTALNILAGIAIAPSTTASGTAATITVSPLGTASPCTAGPLCVSTTLTVQ